MPQLHPMKSTQEHKVQKKKKKFHATPGMVRLWLQSANSTYIKASSSSSTSQPPEDCITVFKDQPSRLSHPQILNPTGLVDSLIPSCLGAKLSLPRANDTKIHPIQLNTCWQYPLIATQSQDISASYRIHASATSTQVLGVHGPAQYFCYKHIKLENKIVSAKPYAKLLSIQTQRHVLGKRPLLYCIVQYIMYNTYFPCRMHMIYGIVQRSSFK